MAAGSCPIFDPGRFSRATWPIEQNLGPNKKNPMSNPIKQKLFFQKRFQISSSKSRLALHFWRSARPNFSAAVLALASISSAHFPPRCKCPSSPATQPIHPAILVALPVLRLSIPPPTPPPALQLQHNRQPEQQQLFLIVLLINLLVHTLS
ncbi:hypothetical protein Ddc_11567 [Ditylenchus destructor]|nr:hypothetical protein Ddc_11567 [Ditylenchus destructor]